MFAATASAIPWIRYFPGALSIITDVFPDLTQISVAFSSAGFRQCGHDIVRQVSAANLADLYERIRLRADSTLAMLPDHEFARGLAQMEVDVRVSTTPAPISEPLELVVFR